MKSFNIHEWRDKHILSEMMNCPKCGQMGHGHSKCPQYDGPGAEGKMAKGDVIELAHDAADVAGMIGPNTNLPEWVESKITLAADYLNTVKDYLTHYDASREKLMEQGFDDRLKSAMGMSDDEFEDQVASRDIESPFPNPEDDDVSVGYKKASDLKDKLRKEYRSMSDQDLDDFSVEMIKHFLDNVEAKDYARKILNKTTK